MKTAAAFKEHLAVPGLENSSSAALPKRLRIAVLNRSFCATGGGAERYSIALVEHLANRHEIHVFAQEIAHAWPSVAYHRISRPLVKPRWINQLWFATATWWATRHGFDIVHSHENTWHGNVQTVHVLPVKHTLLEGRTGWRLGLRWLKIATSPRLLAYLALEALRLRPDKNSGRSVIATSPTLRATVAATYPKIASALAVITPGIQTVAAAPLHKKEQLNIRAAMGLPAADDHFCLLFVANDLRKKGLQCLLEALALGDSHWILMVVGSLSQMPSFKAIAQGLGIADRVFFLGPMADVSLAYQAADCLVHPTQEDTFAMVVLEAMAHGLPVVVSGGQYCGISALLVDGKQALLLNNPNNATELSQAISQLAAKPELRKRLATAGGAFAAGYVWSAIALKQEEIYFSVSKKAKKEHF